MSFAFSLPIRIESEANKRGHWAKHAQRVKAHRTGALLVTASHLRFNGRPPKGAKITVRFTRYAPRKLDSDNLSSAFKACRDGVCNDAIGIDDGDPCYTFDYAQQKSKTCSAYIEVMWK